MVANRLKNLMIELQNALYIRRIDITETHYTKYSYFHNIIYIIYPDIIY